METDAKSTRSQEQPREGVYRIRQTGASPEDRVQQWIKERTVVLQVLEGYPDAREEIIRGLKELYRRLKLEGGNPV